MYFALDTINGVAVGIEYVPAMEGDNEGEVIDNTIIIDFFIIRLLIQWP